MYNIIEELDDLSKRIQNQEQVDARVIDQLVSIIKNIAVEIKYLKTKDMLYR